MIRDLHQQASRLQDQLLRASSYGDDWPKRVPRVMLDSWASLLRWHECGERVWRITPAAADETGDMLLPADLPLASARVRAEGMCYQLPDRREWIVLARHAPAPREVVVSGPVRWAYRQPVLTYCTQIDGVLAAGYYSLEDYPTPAQLPLTMMPGTSHGLQAVRALGPADTVEEEARVALALLQHYLP